MISSLRGTVLSIAGAGVVLEVHGVGYQVHLTPQHAMRLHPGEETLILTSLIVRDDALTLYGFADADERVLFELLTGVSGVGPKSALGVLAELSPRQVAAAVEADDDRAFRKVSGIGPKTAKLIVVQLAGKLAAFAGPAPAASGRPAAPSAAADDVVVALTGLGWPERTAREAVDEVLGESDAAGSSSVPVLLRAALTRLGPARNPVNEARG